MLKCFFIFSLVFALFGCTNEDKNLEKKLNELLIKKSNDESSSLNLATAFGDEWEQICLQGPYLPEMNFEKIVGRDVKGYQGSGDDVHKFWIFYSNGDQKWVAINRLKIMDKHPRRIGVPCTSHSYPFLYLEYYDGKKSYFFDDRE